MINLLNIEDSELDHELILRNLKKGGLTDINAKRVQTEEELRLALSEQKWTIVVSDYNVPGFDPMYALEIVRESSKELPFIVVSGLVGEESVADMMKAGVEDFVIKSRLERLAPVVRRALRELEVHEQEAKSRALAKKAFEAKEQMLAIVYHDIKNPLSAIQLDAQMLELLSHKQPSQEVMVELRLQSERILRTVDRLKGLVADLLEKNNPQLDTDAEHSFLIKRALHSPTNVINDVLDSFRPLIQEKNISIKKSVVQRKMETLFDKDRIFQVISNLLGNALKFTPVEGEIAITFEEDKTGEYTFTISDSGSGIAEKDLSLIFDKYWTGGSGHGLGLYICKSIVEAHGGSIHAGNNPTGGAFFTFTIPCLVDKKQQSNAKESSISSKTIYIVDDDEDLREVITWALEKDGFRVFPYNNPQLALDDFSHTNYPPNLIILDFHMGKMNGNEFLNLKNKSESPHIKNCPVLMISAAPEEVEKSIPSDHYREILVKPIDLTRLLRAVRTYT